MAEQPNSGGVPTTSLDGLTIDEMLQKYPEEEVERAIYNRAYVENKTIGIYKDMIAKGSNVETASKALQDLLECTPSEPPIDSDEPADLDPDVLWRIRYLKYVSRDRPVARLGSILDFDPESIDPESVVNRDAILNAYRRGDLKVVAGEMSVWFAGNLVLGPLQSSELRIDDIVDKTPEWRKQYGPDRVWEEDPTRKFRQKKCQGVLTAVGENWTHLFSIRARLIGKTEFITINKVLDDTGSDFLELFSRDDCVQLGLTNDYGHWKDDVELDISSHRKI